MAPRYRIEIKKSAAREIRSITSRPDRVRVLEIIGGLADEPRPAGVRKLSGVDAWRLRVGRFRIIYSIQDDVLEVWIIKVGDREDVYR